MNGVVLVNGMVDVTSRIPLAVLMTKANLQLVTMYTVFRVFRFIGSLTRPDQTKVD